MAGEPPVIALQGMAGLQRAFSRVSRDLGRGVKEALEAGGEPVRDAASRKVREELSGMRRSRIPWWRMRIGVTRVSVYVAPEQRGVKGRGHDRKRRPTLVDDALPLMEEAVVENSDRIEDSVLQELDELFRMWERV